jgi:hypothetical protein
MPVNSSYLGGGDWEEHSCSPALALGPEFKPQCHQQNKHMNSILSIQIPGPHLRSTDSVSPAEGTENSVV